MAQNYWKNPDQRDNVQTKKRGAYEKLFVCSSRGFVLSGAADGAGEDQSDGSATDVQHVSGNVHPALGVAGVYAEGDCRKASRSAGERYRDWKSAYRHRHGPPRQAG